MAEKQGMAVKQNLPLPRYFMKFKIEFREITRLAEIEVKALLVSAVEIMFGGAWPLDLLVWNADSSVGIVATSKEGQVGVRAAMTLFSSYEKKACNIVVMDASAFLFSLAADRMLKVKG